MIITENTPSKKNLTEFQLKEYYKILEWLKKDDNDNLFYLLEGRAGTGKTFLVKTVIDSYIKKGHSVAVLAPTHKALNVISENFSNLTCKTLHSALGLRIDVSLPDFDPTNLDFFMDTESQIITNYQLVIVDECSMINDKLYEYITSLARIDNTKLLFVGDIAQAKPVKQETYSKVFEIGNRSILTKVERTKDEIIKEISEKVRFKNFNRYDYSNLIISRKEFINDHCGDFIILSYTNSNVNLWNYAVKNKLRPNAPHYFSKYDKVLFYTTLSDWDNNKKKKIDIVKNGEIKSIDAIDKIDLYDATSQKSIEYLTLYIEGTKEPLYICLDMDYFKSNYEKMTEKAKKEQNNQIRKMLWKEFFTWKRRNIIYKDVKISKYLTVKRDIDLAHAMTIHKSQGSTFDNVAVDIRDLDKLMKKDPQEYWNLLYVAVSRAKNKLIFL